VARSGGFCGLLTAIWISDQHRGEGAIFKMADQSRHSTIDTLQANVRYAEIFNAALARTCCCAMAFGR
jgi:hypothetical protein